MNPKIESLEIHSFRGIKNNNLKMNGKSLLIFGENGTGKSSIVNAIEFSLTNDINSLKGASELKLVKHAPHIKSDSDDLKIITTFENGDKITKKIKTNDYPENSELKTYIKEANNGSFILSREKLLKFIKAAPNERYKAIGNIIGLEKLDKVEESFKKVNNTFQKKLEKIKESKKMKYLNIGKKFQCEITSEKELVTAINNELERNNLKPIDLSEQIEKIIENIIKNKENLSKTNYEEIIKNINSFKIDHDFEFKKINEIVKKLSSEPSKDSEIVELLEKSLDYLSEKKIKECPLCENKIEDVDLKKLIEDKLKNFNDEMKIENNLKKLINTNIVEIEKLKEDLSKILKSLQNNKNTVELSKNIEKYIEIIENKIIYLTHFRNFNFNIEIEEDYNFISKIKKEIEEIKENIIEKCRSEEEEKNKKLSNLLEIVISSLNHLKEIRKLNEKEKSMEKKYNLIKTIDQTFQKTKIKAVQNILKKIFNDVNSFYSYIHKGDLISKVKFIQPHSTGLQLIINYFDNEDDPRAFSSEGHLDTLGLCIFLAFIKNFHKKCSLIILDDIVTTVDIPHKEKIARLLFEKFPQKQFIITTHDRLWYKQVINMENIYNLRNNFENCEIIRWDVENGPELSTYKPSWDKIQMSLDNNDLNCASNESRRYLEYNLQKICEVNEVKLRMGGMYTVAEMKDPAIKKIRKTTKKTTFKNYYEEIFDELDKTVIMGNLLSHNNEESENCSINEVRSFCEAVNNLKNSIVCEKCGGYLRFENTSKKILCSEEKCMDTVS